MPKKALIVIVFLAAVAVVVLFSFFPQPKQKIASDNASSTDAAVQEDFAPASIEKEKVSEPYYSIDLEYPKSSEKNLPEIAKYINNVRAEFLELVPKTDEEAEYQGITADRAYILKTTTKVYQSSSTVTYKLETYMYTGGAHGNTFVQTFTYTKDDNLIPLDNILSSPGSLGSISEAARAYFTSKLGTQIEKSELEMGTEPKEENFASWYLTDDAIVFIFQQYQIGPYVLGIQEFPLKRSEAKGILNI